MSFKKKILKFIPTNRNIDKIADSTIEKNEFAVVIHTCDKYSFCWEGWNYYFQENWASSPNIKVYFINEEKIINYPNVTRLPTGVGEWSDRLKRGLNMIPEKYILYMQEDFWLTSPIDINKYLKIFKHLSMNALRITHDCHYYYLHKCFFAESLPFHKYSRRSKYLVSHQASIWNKDFFLSCLEDNETPWINEDLGTKRLRERKTPLNLYITPHIWYAATCRGGKLTKEGLEMMKSVK